MTNQSTIDNLIEMRLTAMADALRIQMDDPAMKEVPFEDRFGMLVDVGYSNRKNNRLKRLMQIAGRNGHLCHIRRTPKDIISGQPRTY